MSASALRIAVLLASAALVVSLLGPLLTTSSLLPGQTLRVYFEPGAHEDVAVAVGPTQFGYMTEIGVDAHGDLQIPDGRTIAIALPPAGRLSVRTAALDLAPYVVLATQGGQIGSDASQVVDAVA